MNQRRILLISSIALIAAGILIGIISIMQLNVMFAFSLAALFFAILFVVLGLNLLIIKVVLKK